MDELLQENPDLSGFNVVLPGKRPIVFIKKILAEKKYSGFLPNFFTIEDLLIEISGKQPVQGISLWLFAYNVYQKLPLLPKDDFAQFLKWFPTVLKDWDDMMKFSQDDKKVLEYMVDEERIRDWAQNLGEENENVPRKKFLNFWKNMNVFLPILKKELQEKNWATSGMIHQEAKHALENFVSKTNLSFVFCGFNAFTPVEENLIRTLLQWDKALVYFHADAYYLKDLKQEAGHFLRNHENWKEFNGERNFSWIENDFVAPKNIRVYEVAGNVTQTKILPEIIGEITNSEEKNLSDTAVVLLDENLLPACIDALNFVENLNITMGFPLKNLGFSNAIKHLFHLQKQLEKNKSSYYYSEVISVLEEVPYWEKDKEIISHFKKYIKEYNIVYISEKIMREKLSGLSYFSIFEKQKNPIDFLDTLINFCYQVKFGDLDDLQFENISHFEKSFKIIKNQISPFTFQINMETLELLVNQLINSETIDFQGEPLEGLQVMGLLETRLLNFKNIILLSVNEGKLPLGNSQNTYLPFDVRHHFNLHTFLENDRIYAYHFYRLIQESKNVHLLYNSLNSGVNSGEKSRFITQIEMESPHFIEHLVTENASEPIQQEEIVIAKTPIVLEKLVEWKKRISPTHLTNYLYNPIGFYLNKILETKESAEIEEELSVKNYGNLIHYSLQFLYERLLGKLLTEKDLLEIIDEIDEKIEEAIKKLKHQKEFYESGINYVHKTLAKKVIEGILHYDLQLIKQGHSLKILGLELKFEEVVFYLNEDKTDEVSFYGFIDRIDELDDEIRIIDYKTAKTKELKLKIEEHNQENYLMHSNKKQALQLVIYQYVIENLPQFKNQKISTGIWSFAEVNSGVFPLEFVKGNLEEALVSVRNLILEILNPEIDFVEEVHSDFSL